MHAVPTLSIGVEGSGFSVRELSQVKAVIVVHIRLCLDLDNVAPVNHKYMIVGGIYVIYTQHACCLEFLLRNKANGQKSQLLYDPLRFF